MTANHAHTPTTEQVRDGFRYDELAEWYDPVTPHHVINGMAFDRWLAQVEAAAEQRGAIKALRDYASPENELHMLIWDDGEVPSWQALELANIVKSDILNRANELESADQEGDRE